MTQRELQFETEAIGKVRSEVRDILSAGRWLTAEEVRRELLRRGFAISDAATTARIRDLRKPRFGRLSIACERAGGKYRYRIVD